MTMPASRRCHALYRRPAVLTDPDEELVVRCTFLDGHPRAHSFFALQTQDSLDMEQQGVEAEGDLPSPLDTFLADVTAGRWDAYLEAILAVAHGRKRARHGTPGFRGR